MNVLSIILIFIGINIDTFIALLFIIPRTNFLNAVTGFTFANLLLWLLGFVFSKTITMLFPEWITGLMGIVLIALVFKKEGSPQTAVVGSGKIFLLCLSLGGDNLAFFIPWAVDMSVVKGFMVAGIFVICTVVTTVIGLLITRNKIVTQFFERYASYGTKLVYLCAGIYVVLSSNLLPHLFALI